MLLSILVLAKSKVNAFVEVSTGYHLENNCDVNLAVLEPLFSLSGVFLCFVSIHRCHWETEIGVHLEQRCCSSTYHFISTRGSQSKHFSVSRSWSRCGIWKSNVCLSGNGLWGISYLLTIFFYYYYVPNAFLKYFGMFQNLPDYMIALLLWFEQSPWVNRVFIGINSLKKRLKVVFGIFFHWEVVKDGTYHSSPWEEGIFSGPRNRRLGFLLPFCHFLVWILAKHLASVDLCFLVCEMEESWCPFQLCLFIF